MNENKTHIGINYGERLLKIIAPNMDDINMRNNETLREFDRRMQHMNADIVCTQETHNARTKDKLTKNYRYMSTAALKTNGGKNEKGIGGCAILIKKEWIGNITKIARYAHRCVKISLQTGIQTKPFIS